MPLSPPICLYAFFQYTRQNGNDYETKIDVDIPQAYSPLNPTPPFTPSYYTASNIAVGMYATSNLNGKVFRIKSILSPVTQTPAGGTTVTVILEDIDGFNKQIDTEGRGYGNPDLGNGYIFELNSNGLPALTAVINPPTITFPDSILGRFVNDNLSLGNRTFLDTNLVLVGDPSPSNASVATSSKGITLEQRANVSLFTVGNAVAYNGHMYVAVGQGTSRIATSTDGITWTGRTATNLFTLGRAIIWDGSRWIAGGENSTSFKLATSTDGITWTAVSVSFGNVRSLAWSPSLRLYVAGVAGSSNSTRLYTSSDLSTWTARTIPLNSTFEITQINTIVWNGSRFMLGGVTNDNRSSPLPVTTATSLDGITWTLTAGARLLGSTSGCIGLAHNGSRWVAVGGNRTDGSISYSDNDGGLWTSAGTVFGSGGDDARGTGVTWTGSSWVACGFSRTGTSYTTLTAISTDGATWTTYNQTSTFASPINGIVSKHPYSFAEPESRLVVTNRGSSLVPSIYQSDSQSTGIYFPDTNNVAVSTQGLERMRITNTGNVGIGTTTNPAFTLDLNGSIGIGPSNARQVLFLPPSQLGTSVASFLTIVGGSGSPDSGRIFFGDNSGWKMHFSRRTSSITTDLMTIQDNGRVGIGTTVPSDTLDVAGNISTRGGTTSTIGSVRLVPGSGGANNGISGFTEFLDSAGNRRGYIGNITSNLAELSTSSGVDLRFITNGGANERMRITSAGRVGIGLNNPPNLTSISFPTPVGFANRATNVISNYQLSLFDGGTGTGGLYLGSYFTASVGAASTIQSSDTHTGQLNPAQLLLQPLGGNIGIGMNNPTSLLDLSGGGVCLSGLSTNSQARPALTTTTNQATPAYEIRSRTVNGGDGFLRIRSGQSAGSASYIDLTGFSTVADMANNISFGTASAERMRIANNGNVGIGTTQPLSRLQVVGTIDTYALAPPSSDTHLSVVSSVPYSAVGNVLMDIGAQSRTPGNHGTIYRYRLGFVNNTNQTGGSFQIIAVPTAPGGEGNPGYNADGTPLPRLTINPFGNVGIGRTDPAHTLDVNGIIRGSGSIVNVATSSTPFITTYNSVGGNTSAAVVTITYTPKQSGNVKVIVEGNVEWYTNGVSNDTHSVYLADSGSTLFRTQRQRWNSANNLSPREQFISGDLNFVDTINAAKTYRIVIAAGGGSVSWRNAHLIVSEISST